MGIFCIGFLRIESSGFSGKRIQFYKWFNCNECVVLPKETDHVINILVIMSSLCFLHVYVSRGKERFITCLYWIPFLKKNGGYCFIRICRGECIGGFFITFSSL